MSRKRISKVIILGDSAVGKTSMLHSCFTLIYSYVDQKFVQSHKATVGADFMEKDILVDGKLVCLEIWDTAGQERFKSMGMAFYRGADCCVLVYDITNKASFDHLESWIKEFIDQGSPEEPQNFPFVLIGNKIDKEEERQVDDYLLREFLLKYPKIKHLTASAKNNLGIDVAFDTIARCSLQNRKEEIYKPIAVSIRYKQIQPNRSRRKRCC